MNISVNIQLDEDDPVLTSDDAAAKIFEAFGLDSATDTCSVSVTSRPETTHIAPPPPAPV